MFMWKKSDTEITKIHCFSTHMTATISIEVRKEKLKQIKEFLETNCEH